MLRLHYHHYRGFTFVEILATLATIGILTGLALPTFSTYVVKSRRTDAINTILNLQQNQEKYMFSNTSAATLAQLGSSSTSSNGYYTITVATNALSMNDVLYSGVALTSNDFANEFAMDGCGDDDNNGGSSGSGGSSSGSSSSSSSSSSGSSGSGGSSTTVTSTSGGSSGSSGSGSSGSTGGTTASTSPTDTLASTSSSGSTSSGGSSGSAKSQLVGYTITATAVGNQARDTQNGVSCATLTMTVNGTSVTRAPAACWNT